MLETSKSLALGLFLILLASAVLLYTDRGPRKSAGNQSGPIRVALVEHALTQVVEEGMQGALEALAARGYADGGRITTRRFNAENGDRLIMMNRGTIPHDFRGTEEARVRPDQLLARFEDVRRRKQLDASIAGMLERCYA